MKTPVKIRAINVPVLFIKENKKITAFCPVLDIATCGKDIDEAKRRFEELIKIFFEELSEMGTLEDVLLESGWRKIGKKEVRWMPPEIVGTITEEIKVPCPS